MVICLQRNGRFEEKRTAECYYRRRRRTTQSQRTNKPFSYSPGESGITRDNTCNALTYSSHCLFDLLGNNTGTTFAFYTGQLARRRLSPARRLHTEGSNRRRRRQIFCKTGGCSRAEKEVSRDKRNPVHRSRTASWSWMSAQSHVCPGCAQCELLVKFNDIYNNIFYISAHEWYPRYCK